MKVAIKYFGMIREACEKQEEEMDFKGGVIKDLDAALRSKYPKIYHLNYKFAVNKMLVDEGFELKESDEVALLPPFAGG